MGKFTNTHKLSKQQQNELFMRFAKVLASVHGSLEAAKLIRDLFSEQESLMLARRIQIAEMLMEGYTYAQIRQSMKVSETTISKVKAWLELYGDGYRVVLGRNKEPAPESENPNTPWKALKRQYPMYF